MYARFPILQFTEGRQQSASQAENASSILVARSNDCGPKSFDCKGFSVTNRDRK